MRTAAPIRLPCRRHHNLRQAERGEGAMRGGTAPHGTGQNQAEVTLGHAVLTKDVVDVAQRKGCRCPVVADGQFIGEQFSSIPGGLDEPVKRRD